MYFNFLSLALASLDDYIFATIPSVVITIAITYLDSGEPSNLF